MIPTPPRILMLKWSKTGQKLGCKLPELRRRYRNLTKHQKLRKLQKSRTRKSKTKHEKPTIFLISEQNLKKKLELLHTFPFSISNLSRSVYLIN